MTDDDDDMVVYAGDGSESEPDDDVSKSGVSEKVESLRTTVRETLGPLWERVQHGGATYGSSAKQALASGGDTTSTVLTSGKAKIIYVCTLLLGALLGLAYVSWMLAGPISTVLYAFLFLVGALGIPTTVMFLSPSFTRGLRSAFGKLHFIMGQVTYGGGFLVEFENRWEMCPTRRTDDGIEVYIEDEWEGPVEGEENLSVLGWQRFGVLRNKDDDTYKAIRYDGAATDGGEGATRGGHAEVAPPANTNGWILDLKRIWSGGIQKIGDIGLIEKAEEVAMRNEAKDGMTTGWEPIIGAIIGLLLGTGTAYVLL